MVLGVSFCIFLCQRVSVISAPSNLYVFREIRNLIFLLGQIVQITKENDVNRSFLTDCLFSSKKLSVVNRI